ncbi:MAG TPA: hypothetical protein VFY84_15950 [Jiangellales bacterium]|nr:hypothetical protein [Jiangellales bacterium]
MPSPCLIRFPNIYRLWLRQEVSIGALLVDDLALFDRPISGGPAADPAELAVIRQEIDTRLAGVPARVRKMMLLTAVGWTQQDIAAHVGTTTKAVERALNYYRTPPPKKGIA